MANLNLARTMTLEQEELALFNAEEHDMYFHDRMCFYANVEQRYASVATASPTPTLQPRAQPVQSIARLGASGAPSLASSDAAYYQSALWQSWMPNHILSIYAPATANSSILTATTTCSGLGGAPSITVPYIQARVSSHATVPTPTNENEIANAATAQAKTGGSAVFGAIVAIAGLIVL